MLNVDQILRKLGYHQKVTGNRKGRIEFSCKTPRYAVNRVEINSGEQVIVFKKGRNRLSFPLDGGFNILKIYENYNWLNSLDNQIEGNILPNVPANELQLAIEFLYHTGFKGDFTVNVCKGEISQLDPTTRKDVREKFRKAGYWKN